MPILYSPISPCLLFHGPLNLAQNTLPWLACTRHRPEFVGPPRHPVLKEISMGRLVYSLTTTRVARSVHISISTNIYSANLAGDFGVDTSSAVPASSSRPDKHHSCAAISFFLSSHNDGARDLFIMPTIAKKSTSRVSDSARSYPSLFGLSMVATLRGLPKRSVNLPFSCACTLATGVPVRSCSLHHTRAGV